jgi:hypothetical protein
MADTTEHDDGELIEQFTKRLDAIGDDSALAGCVSLLESALPGEGERVWTKASLLAFFIELTRLLGRARQGESIDEVDPQSDDDPDPTDASFRYYDGHAKHSRTLGKQAEFVGAISMVRVTLPRSDSITKIDTRIGSVLASDHGIRTGETFQSVFSVETINALYQLKWDYHGRVADEVQLITGARVRAVQILPEPSFRFTPVSLYLAYAAGEPIFYVVQSGFFDGRPSKLYFARDMDSTIDTISAYRPTPFAAPLHRYRIKLTMADDEPKQLHGEMLPNKAEVPYLTVTLDYRRRTSPPASNSPLTAQVIAFSRVCTIENWLGDGHFRDRPLELVLHQLGLRLGRLLPWREG